MIKFAAWFGGAVGHCIWTTLLLAVFYFFFGALEWYLYVAAYVASAWWGGGVALTNYFDQRFQAESSEPVDEPRTVWVTLDANGDACTWYQDEEDAKATMLQDDRLYAYSKFQQVGTMVRSDDE